jgi:hypothetical protein
MSSAHRKTMHVKSENGPLDSSDERAWHTMMCGHCGAHTSTAVLAFTYDGNLRPVERWVRCTNCGHGSVVAGATQHPGASVGREVEGLPPDVATAYKEARRCAEVNAFTACEMVCRKLLMHVAADKGATGDLTFAGYVTHLEAVGYVTPPMKPWVDFIRKRGNIAVHELPHTTQDEALSTLTFTEQLLRNTYEMAHLTAKYVPPPSPD